MAPVGPDASNSCLPSTVPVIHSIPPVPSPPRNRGDRTTCDGEVGRLNSHLPILLYGSNKLVIVRNILDERSVLPPPSGPGSSSSSTSTKKDEKQQQQQPYLNVMVYRGHRDVVSCVKFSSSGCYCASGDERGTLRVWSYDHVDHLCKYESTSALSGPLKDIDWDGSDNKRIVYVGERSNSDPNGDCGKVIQWDTGVTCGQLGQHMKGRASTVAYKSIRPFKIMTGGKDDNRICFHKGPPFAKVPSTNEVPCEYGHTRGSVHCIRLNHLQTLAISVGSDKSICLYETTTFTLLTKLENVHVATIYACAWSRDDKYVLTCSGDGTCKLLEIMKQNDTAYSILERYTWKPAQAQQQQQQLSETSDNKVPVGGSQIGCAFVQGTIPVSVGYNGQISILAMPKECSISTTSSSDSDTTTISALAALTLNNSTTTGSSSNKDVMKIITGHYAPISSLVLDYPNGVFYTSDTDGILCKWDLPSVQPMIRFQHSNNTTTTTKDHDDLMYTIHSGAIAGVTVLKDTGYVLSVGWDDTMYVTEPPVSPSQPPKVRSNQPIKLPAQPVTIVCGTNVAVIVTVKGLILVSSSSSSNKDVTVSELFPLSYEVGTACCVDKMDATVYVGSKSDNAIYAYDIIRNHSNATSLSFKEKFVIQNRHLKPIHSLCLSNDNTKLASADERDVCVFQLKNNNNGTEYYEPIIERGKWCFHTQRITALSWSLDDTMIASGGADDSIYVWNLQYKNKRVHYPFAHRGGIVHVSFLQTTTSTPILNSTSPYLLLTTGVDAVVNVWDVTKDVQEKFQ